VTQAALLPPPRPSLRGTHARRAPATVGSSIPT